MSNILKDIYLKVKVKYPDKKNAQAIIVSHDVLRHIVTTKTFQEENRGRENTFNLFGAPILSVTSMTEKLTNYMEVL